MIDASNWWKFFLACAAFSLFIGFIIYLIKMDQIEKEAKKK